MAVLPSRPRRWALALAVSAAAIVPSVAPPAALPQAEAAAGSCAGSLVDAYPIAMPRSMGDTRIGEVALYYDRKSGRNCARTVHLGPTRGVRLFTYVAITPCAQTKPSPGEDCEPVPGTRLTEDGDYFRWYAGPVSASARGRCVVVYGSISYRGQTRSAGTDHPSHCGR